MKINKIVSLLLLSAALFSTTLLAQQNLGVKNKYPIGTDDNPVLATEYCEYLNDKAPNDGAIFQSWYYDSSFMSTDQDRSSSPNAAIERRGWSKGYLVGSGYHYYVTPGHQNDRIVAVYWQSVQTEFNQWQAEKEKEKQAELAKNPTRQELCDYINDKIAGRLDPAYLDKASEIQNRYPKAAGLTVRDLDEHSGNIICAPNDEVEQTLWGQVDNLVNGVYGTDATDDTLRVDKKGNAYTTTTHTSASDSSCNNFLQRWGLVISEESDPSFPVSMPKHVVLIDASQQEIRQKWAALFPANFSHGDWGYSLMSITVSLDSTVVTKIPYTPTAPTPEDQN